MSFVYFVRSRATGAIKVGVSNDPLRRLADLQNSSGEELTLLGAIKGDRHREKALHERFAHGCVRGEWFSPTDTIMSAIQKMIDQEAVAPDTLEALIVKSGTHEESEYSEHCSRMVRRLVELYMLGCGKPEQVFSLIAHDANVSKKAIGSLYYRTPEFVTAATYLAILRAYRRGLAEQIERERHDLERSEADLRKIDQTLASIHDV